MCVCVCVCMHVLAHTHTHKHTHHKQERTHILSHIRKFRNQLLPKSQDFSQHQTLQSWPLPWMQRVASLHSLASTELRLAEPVASLYLRQLSPFFGRHTHAQTPMLQPQNPWLWHFLTLWPPHLEQSPPRHQALSYSLFFQKQTQDISLLRIFQLSNTVFHP